MNIIPSLFIVTMCTVNNPLATAQQRLLAVTSLIGYEQFYLQIRRSIRPPLMHSKSVTPKMKADMCADIIGNPLFYSLHRVDPVSSSHKAIYKTLNERHPVNIYQHFYESPYGYEPSSRDILASNPLKRRNVTVDDRHIILEDVFLCLGKNRDSRCIVEYFISPSYNVVNDKYYKRDEKRGVFVFTYNERKKLVVIALAEEPGYISDHTQQLINIVHLFDYKTTLLYHEFEIEDTICGLSTRQKIRLCTLVLNAKRYRGKVRFVPHEDNIDPKCSKRAVQFRHDREDLTWEYDLDEDWVIGCKAVNVENHESVIYRVSAGFHAYEHFVVEESKSVNTLVSGIRCRIQIGL